MQNLPLEREIASLRLRFQANNRLRLEFLGTLSKILRDYGEPVSDSLLDSVVLATPNELADLNRSYEASGSKSSKKKRGNALGTPPQQGDQGPPQQGMNGPPQQGMNGPPQQGEKGPPQHGEKGPPQQGKRGSKKGQKGGAEKRSAKKPGRSKSS